MQIVDHKTRYEGCWQALVAAQQEAGLSNEVKRNPIGIVKAHLREKEGLSDNTSYVLACRFISSLDENILNPVDGSGRRGRSSIAQFKLSQIELPDLSEFISSFAKSENGEMEEKKNNNGDNEILKRLVAIEQQLVVQGAQTSTLLARKKAERKFAIWIDSPNLFYKCEELGYDMPVKQILHHFSQTAKKAYGAAFFNTGCPDSVLRLYTQLDLVLVGCIFAKTPRLGEDMRPSSDAVDKEMIKNARFLVELADIHVIVSGDGDMVDTINFLHQQQKEVYKVYVDGFRKGVVAEDPQSNKTRICGLQVKRVIHNDLAALC